MEPAQTFGGRYTLLNELGAGGMAVVWRARDEVLGRLVAVKVLAGRFADDPESRARIRDEARAAAALSHPNIAQVYDYGEAVTTGTRLPYVVMELVNGPTLQQRAEKGPLPPRTVLRVCGEVAAALAAAHADGLVHRDIKMANIMIAGTGAKVVDFGIAAAVGPAAPDETVVGTPAYLAPERLAGGPVEPASDVYALGVLLYRLLANDSPWSVESTTQMLNAHIYVEPAPLPRLPGVPIAVDDLVGRCLRKDPADRPTAAEVSAALGDAVEAASTPAADVARRPAGDPVVSAPGAASGGGAAVVAGRGVVRNRAVLTAAGAIVTLVIAGLASWGLLPEEHAGDRGWAEPGGAVAVAPPVRQSSPSSPATVATTLAGTPRASEPVAPGDPASTARMRTPAASPTISASPSPSPSPSSAATRLTSPGGVVYAQCEQGKARLTGWEPAAGFEVQQVDPGPAFTAEIVFASASARYRMAVNCVGGVPGAVVLPI